MKTWGVAAVVVLLTASGASAKMLHGPLIPGAGGSFATCTITNLSATKTAEVTIEMRDAAGVILTTTNATLAPQAGTAASDVYALNGYRRCSFNLPGNPKGFAATMSVGASFYSPTTVIPIK